MLFSPSGNDLEALHIHLCFCCSNLPPRRAASFGGTLVSAVSNISTSASRRRSGRSGSGWRLQTGRHRYQPLPAHPSCCCPSVADRRQTGSVNSESSATSHHTPWDKPLISPVTNSFFCFKSVTSPPAVDQWLIFPPVIVVLLATLFKGFIFLLLSVWAGYTFITCTYIYVCSTYTVWRNLLPLWSKLDAL